MRIYKSNGHNCCQLLLARSFTLLLLNFQKFWEYPDQLYSLSLCNSNVGRTLNNHLASHLHKLKPHLNNYQIRHLSLHTYGPSSKQRELRPVFHSYEDLHWITLIHKLHCQARSSMTYLHSRTMGDRWWTICIVWQKDLPDSKFILFNT